MDIGVCQCINNIICCDARIFQIKWQVLTNYFYQEKINSYARMGVDELIIQWISLDDIEGLKLLAKEVLPYI